MKQTNSYLFYLENAITIVLKEKSAKKDSSQLEKHVLHMKAQNYQQFLLKDGPKFKQRRNMAESLNPPPIGNALYGHSPVPTLHYRFPKPPLSTFGNNFLTISHQ